MHVILSLLLLLVSFFPAPPQSRARRIELFDGKTFKGWQGDTLHTWRILDGALVGGSLTEKVPHNQFLSTTKSYDNYVLKLKFKLSGHEGFINGGVQFHSQRIPQPAYEMRGYQADIGKGYWGSLYDESRRDKLLATADPEKINRLLRPNDWNDYEVHTQGRRIRIVLNGEQTVDYTEQDESIPQSGLIAFQIHGGGKAQVHYKDIVLEKLPRKGKRK
ncbi:MAG: 3-keto-disaccharide hydrolase [Adhaeribacter sp.]